LDDNYQTYLNRVARMTLPEAYKTQIQHIQESSKFRVHGGVRAAAPFPGYTLITPPAEEDAKNAAFYSQIQAYQQQLLDLPISSDLIVPVPAASFHLTVADLIWDSAFDHACQKNPQFAEDLNSQLTERFQQYQQLMTKGSHSISWQMLGLIVMPRAIGVCLVPKDKRSYEEIIQFRRIIYQNRKLMGLGIEQHYHFTAHITLGYFGEISPELDRVKLSDTFSDFNQSLSLNIPDFLLNKVELRKFDDMTHYYRQPDWPSLYF
jgi:hypothetical protein